MPDRNDSHTTICRGECSKVAAIPPFFGGQEAQGEMDVFRKQPRLGCLYSMERSLTYVAGLCVSTALTAAPPPAVPPPIDVVKQLCAATPLVAGDGTTVRICCPQGRYEESAKLLRQAIRMKTQISVPRVGDAPPVDGPLLTTHTILLGNRSTNRLLSVLYDHHFALVDLRYPGTGGYVVRSLHNPFGNGCNAIILGGSDDAGVAAAAHKLAERIKTLPDANAAFGWILDVRLGTEVALPQCVREVRIEELPSIRFWSASRGYDGPFFFGWNFVSKAMALYALTGDERWGRQVMKLAYPDAETVARLDKVRGVAPLATIRNPIEGKGHYDMHYMILYWDLIEESPVFTDAQRLRITRSLAKQLDCLGGGRPYVWTGPNKTCPGDRHGLWHATCLYCLARYFNRDYPSRVWAHALQSVHWHYQSLEESAWLGSHNDHLFWYTSYFEPLTLYLILSGRRPGFDNGNALGAYSTQDIVYTGQLTDWGLKTSSIAYLAQMEHITGDGKWLHYRNRTGVDTDCFRIGQSFAPGKELKPRPPTELCNRWTIHRMPEPMWRARGRPLPLEQAFLWGSYRSETDELGDYALLKGHNGAGRYPYHTAVLLELRLNGTTLLKGFGTQVLSSADGMVEPRVAMNAALPYADVLGQTAAYRTSVPDLAYCSWDRTVIARRERFAVFFDKFSFRAEATNMRLRTGWSTCRGRWDAAAHRAVIEGLRDRRPAQNERRLRALDAVCTHSLENATADQFVRLDSHDEVLLRCNTPGNWVEMPFTLAEPFQGEICVLLFNDRRRGQLRFELDGEPVGKLYNHYSSIQNEGRPSIGIHPLAAGPHRLRVTAAEFVPHSSEQCWIGLRGILLRDGAVAVSVPRTTYELIPAAPVCMATAPELRMVWEGPTKPGDKRTNIYLLAPRPAASVSSLRCVQLGADCAALALPHPALAVSGPTDEITAAVALLEPQHLFARAATKIAVGALRISSDKPVDLDWDIGEGSLHVACAEPVELRVSQDDGESLTLEPGRHHLQRRLSKPAADSLADFLRNCLDSATAAAPRPSASVSAEEATQLPDLVPVLTCQTGARNATTLIPLPGLGVAEFAAATGNIVLLLDATGRQVRKLELKSKVTALHWWQAQGLLLAGCEDETVHAFAVDGGLSWSFQSQMAPEARQRMASYWDYPGIHGLGSGRLLDDTGQCFVGSSCTIEILGADGTLVRRLPAFWGNFSQFAVIENNKGRRLLAARNLTGHSGLHVVDPETFTVSKSFNAVPPGHTHVGGWRRFNRAKIIVAPFAGDGQLQVACDVNGVWNRLGVWDGNGKPLHSAPFGSGQGVRPRDNIRDWEITDLDADGRSEFLVVLRSGTLLALDCQCRKIWALALPGTPRELVVTTPIGAAPTMFVGCDDASVIGVNAAGKVVGKAHLPAPPVAALPASVSSSKAVFLDAKGGFTLFAPP